MWDNLYILESVSPRNLDKKEVEGIPILDEVVCRMTDKRRVVGSFAIYGRIFGNWNIS